MGLHMKKQLPRGQKRPLKLDSSAIHCAIVRSYVQNYCDRFSWSKQALGYIRARDYTRLLELGESVEKDLIDAAGRGCAHTEYGTASSFKLATQFAALITKYQFSPREIPGLDPDTAAIQDFLKAERRNKRLNIVFAEHLKRGTERHWSIPLIRDVFCRVLGRTPHYEDVLDKADFSSGAAVNLKGKRTHLAVKLGATELEGNPASFPYFINAIFRNASYSQIFAGEQGVATEVVAPLGSTKQLEQLQKTLLSRMMVCMHDLIDVVPKKARSGRTIGKNPKVNNFCQKGLDKVMRNLLIRKLGIDLSDQDSNCVMAYYGSLPDQTDPYVTLDVKGASNSVLTQLVRSVTPPRWFKLMNSLRSTHWCLEDGVLQPYEMYVGMGNGFCFPLESLLFAAICIAAYKHTGHQPDYRIYGDDIIVRQSHALVVKEILAACGFQLNVQKSYVFGPFRESCGANWYGGEGVTPGYIKERINNTCDLHVIHNALYDYPLVQRDIRGMVESSRLCCVPDFKAWSYVTDQAFRVPFDVAVSAPGTYFDNDIQNFVYRIRVTTPEPDEDWAAVSPIVVRRRQQFLLAAVLRGSASHAPFHFRRSVKVRTTTTRESDEASTRALIKKCDSLHQLKLVSLIATARLS